MSCFPTDVHASEVTKRKDRIEGRASQLALQQQKKAFDGALGTAQACLMTHVSTLRVRTLLNCLLYGTISCVLKRADRSLLPSEMKCTLWKTPIPALFRARSRLTGASPSPGRPADLSELGRGKFLHFSLWCTGRHSEFNDIVAAISAINADGISIKNCPMRLQPIATLPKSGQAFTILRGYHLSKRWWTAPGRQQNQQPGHLLDQSGVRTKIPEMARDESCPDQHSCDSPLYAPVKKAGRWGGNPPHHTPLPDFDALIRCQIQLVARLYIPRLVPEIYVVHRDVHAGFRR